MLDNIGVDVKEDSAALISLIDTLFPRRRNDPDSMFARMCAVHQFICDSLSIVGYDESIENKPLLYYLQNKKIDRLHLYALYRKLLRILDIKYYYGYGRNKYAGVLDSAVAASHHITDVFFGVKDSKEKMHFFFVSKPDETFYPDEIPSYLEGTTAMLVYKHDEKSDSEEVIPMKIPPSTSQVNFHNERMKITIAFDKEEDRYDFREYFSGTLASEYRTYLNKITSKNKDLDTEYLDHMFPDNTQDTTIVMENSSVPPFPVTINYLFKCPTLLTEIADSFYTIPLKKLIHFEVVTGNEQSRTLDYYTEQKYQHRCDYQLEFDKPMEIVNGNKFNVTTENGFGIVEAKIQQLNNHTIMIHLVYAVNAFHLPASHYSEIKTLEKSFDRFLNSAVIIKKI